VRAAQAEVTDRVDVALLGRPYGFLQKPRRACLAGACAQGDPPGGLSHGRRVLQ
jgi:hypothetical protein